MKNLRFTVPVPKKINDLILNEYGDPRKQAVAQKVIRFIIRNHQRSNSPMAEHLPYCKCFKEQAIPRSRDYHIWGELVDKEILQEFTFPNGAKFSKPKKRCKKYRIHPDFLSGNVVDEEIIEDFDEDEESKDEGNTYNKGALIEALNKLSINLKDSNDN